MSYKKLEIWQLAKELVIEIHQMTLKLPKFEMFEEGQQIRRSIKSVKSTIVASKKGISVLSKFFSFPVTCTTNHVSRISHLK